MSAGAVGRESELAEVERFLDGASRGFAVLVLEGEAGIGKTTVWREARWRAEQRGERVLWCRPSAAEAKFSFAGVADLLASVDEEAFLALPKPQREAIEVALLRSAPTAHSPFARAAAAGFLTLIRAVAAAGPVLLAVDDWQWLDLSSRRVLEFAARRLEAEPVGLLCSIRTPIASPLSMGVVDEQRLRRIALGPLSLAALGRIAYERLGCQLPRPLLVRILQATGGNPFYALEVARLVAERGREYEIGCELPVPDDLRKLTAGRFRRLPRRTREALLLAAVLSEPDARSIDAKSLAPAEEAEIVRIDRRGRIEFAHPLFASAAYGSVALARRQALHRRAAELVSDPEQRARHSALSSARPDVSVATQLHEAATRAASRGAPEAAAELSELAAQRTPAADAEAHAERVLSAASFHFDAGDLARAEALVEEVIAAPCSDSLRVKALQLAAQLATRRSNFTRSRELALTALRAAGDDARMCAAIELDLAYCAVSLGDIAGAVPHAQIAVACAQEVGEKGMLGDALAVLTMAEFLSGRGLDEARLRSAVALDDPHTSVAWMMRPRVIQGMLQLWTGELADALSTLSGVYEGAVERGQEAMTPMLSLYLAWAHVWRGELARAAAISEDARERTSLLDDPAALATALSAGALAHSHDGRTDLARSEAADALRLFERVQWRSGAIFPLWALGLAELSDENLGGVDAVLGPLAAQVAQMGAGDPVLMMFLPDEIEALIGLGELDRARQYLEPFERSARELDRAWALAMAQRCRGALHAAHRQPELALAAFQRSLDAHQRAGMPLERARTLLLAGQVCRRQKQWGQARQTLGEALSEFERVGAKLWARRARAEIERIGRTVSAQDELSSSERRVAELAASGLSNKEIAQRAFLSVKTVEANLTRAYRKLGVHSRSGLAGALAASAHRQ